MTVNFRKNLVTGLMAASLAVVSWGALAVSTPIDVDVTFTGTILDNTCGTPSTGTGVTVPFGNISQTNFTGQGSTGATKDFTIEFTGCGTEADDVEVWFRGTADGSDGTALENTGGTSTGLAVQVWNNSGSQLEINNETSPILYSGILTANGGGSMPLVAKAVQTTATAPSLGTLNTTGTLVVQYP